MGIFLTTTGTAGTVALKDLGNRTFTHPTVDHDLLDEFSESEIRSSRDVQAQVTAGTILIKDDDGNTIATLAEMGGHDHRREQIMDIDDEYTVADQIMVSTGSAARSPITVAASELVGKAAAGNVTNLSASDVRTILNVEDGADVTDATNVAAAGAVMDADFTAADEVMVGTGAGTHSQVTLAASELLGKAAAGNVTNLSASDVRTILNVEDGADVTDAVNVAAAGALMDIRSYHASLDIKVDESEVSAALNGDVSKQFVPTHIVIKVASATAPNADGTINVGTSTDGSDILSAQALTGLDAAGKVRIVPLAEATYNIAGNATLYVNVEAADSGTALVVDVYVVGRQF